MSPILNTDRDHANFELIPNIHWRIVDCKQWLDMGLSVSFRSAFSVGVCPFDTNGRKTNFRVAVGLIFHALVLTSIAAQIAVDASAGEWRPPGVFDHQRFFSKSRQIFLAVSVAINLYWYYLDRSGKVQEIILRLKTYKDIGPHNNHSERHLVSNFNFYLFLLLASLPIYSSAHSPDEDQTFYAWLRLVAALFLSIAFWHFYCLLRTIANIFEQLNAKTPLHKNLERCADVHAEICKLTREINRVHSFLLIFFITENLIIVTTRIYEGLSAFLRYFQVPPLELTAVVASRLLQVVLLCNTCTQLTEESGKFRRVLSRAMRAQYFPCYNRKLRIYLETMPLAQITASGFFIVSNAVIPTLLTSSMTYIIVLLQLF